MFALLFYDRLCLRAQARIRKRVVLPAPIHESRLRLGYLLKARRSAGRWWSSDKADWKSVVVTWSGRRLYPLHSKNWPSVSFGSTSPSLPRSGIRFNTENGRPRSRLSRAPRSVAQDLGRSLTGIDSPDGSGFWRNSGKGGTGPVDPLARLEATVVLFCRGWHSRAELQLAPRRDRSICRCAVAIGKVASRFDWYEKRHRNCAD